MAAKPYRPKQTAKQKKAYKERNFGEAGRLGAMGGGYGRKATNLTKKELRQSGALKASKKRTVDISQTKRDYSRGITLGPGGKPLTGTVTLANGRTAVYKGGKRVQKTPASQLKNKRVVGGGAGGGTGGGTDKGKSKVTTTRVPPSQRGEGAGGTKPPSGGGTTRKYVHDSFIPRRSGLETMTDAQRRKLSKNNPYRTGRRATNRPGRGERSRLQRDASGNYRWVKVV